jgi:Spy/CpxP family protein refolding chaperone
MRSRAAVALLTLVVRRQLAVFADEEDAAALPAADATGGSGGGYGVGERVMGEGLWALGPLMQPLNVR